MRTNSKPTVPDANSPPTMLTGVVAGYDPGGDGRHGVAELRIQDGKPSTLKTKTCETAEAVIRFLEGLSPIALGVDTLTCWSTGPSGWRPADLWLRKHKEYKDVSNRVVAPNSLSGSMSLNGMAVLVEARLMFPGLLITETHPKVLYWHLWGEKYDYIGRKDAMDKELASALGLAVNPATEHEWDAALSALAAFRGASGQWSHDLHSLPVEDGERLVSPCGKTMYFWPD